MPYEPTGKLKPFIDALRLEPTRIWTPAEIAAVMGVDVQTSSISGWMAYPMRAGVVFRGKKGGKVVFSGQQFPPEAAYPAPAERNLADDIRIPKFGAYTPPQMTAPRAGSDVPAPSRAPGPPPAASPGTFCLGCTRQICRDKGCMDGRLSAVVASPAPSPEPTPAPTAAPVSVVVIDQRLSPTTAPVATPAPSPAAAEIDPRFAAAHYGHDLFVGDRPGDGMAAASLVPEAAPALADASTSEEAVLEVDEPAEEEPEAIEPDAFICCRTGEIVLVGLEPDEDGRVTIPADLAQMIRRQTAWGPPR